MKKKALITGIAGQDGSYLSEILLEKGYDVYGTIRRQSIAENQQTRIDKLSDSIETAYADLSDFSSLCKLLQTIQPDEVYNLAAMSHVRISFDIPLYTIQINALGTANILEACRIHCPNVKFYQASSSEMFGNSIEEGGYQKEDTPMHPVSPYGCAKLFAYSLIRNYRHSYKMFAANGILFNHESPRRGTNFVTNKVVKTAVMIKKGLEKDLVLGNMDSYRDWGHSKDYCKAMTMILGHDEPDDFVVATGVAHSVRDLCEYVFARLDLDCNEYVKQDPKYMRPEELKYLRGVSDKAKSVLGWEPEYTFETLLDEMIDYWMEK